jgi:hypothetical protein
MFAGSVWQEDLFRQQTASPNRGEKARPAVWLAAMKILVRCEKLITSG